MVIHADRLNEDLMSTISVTREHHGLSYVRTLRIDSDYKPYGHNYHHPDRSESTMALYTLFKVMPEHALTRFE